MTSGRWNPFAARPSQASHLSPGTSLPARLLSLLCLVCFLFPSLLPAASPEVEHVVVVSLDGFMPAYYLEPDRFGLKIPALRALVRSGAAAEGMRSVFPTLTYPAHTSLVTGVSPRRHGIFTNEAADPSVRYGLRWYAHEVRSRTLYQAAEERSLRTALVLWPVTLGAVADANFPEFWRGDNDDLELLKAISTPGLVARVQQRFPSFRYDTPPATRDQDMADIAVHLIHSLRPHLLLVHMIGVDHATHDHGIDSPQTRDAVENADAQVGRIVAALEETGLWSRAALFVVSDHGFAPVEKVIKPRILLRRANLLVTDERDRVVDWQAEAICGGSTCEILLRDLADPALQQRVDELFQPLASGPDKVLEQIYSPAGTRELSPDPHAFMILEAAAGFHFQTGLFGSVVGPAQDKAAHGTHPDRPGQRAAFVAAGAGIQPQRLKQLSILDVAPTIAHLLGLDLPDTEGRVLHELFAPPN